MRGATIAILAAILVSGVASADVLWDQSDWDSTVPGFFNSVSGSPPFGLTHYVVNDVTVDGAGWYVHKISAYYGAADFAWGDGIVDGYLNVYPKTDVLPITGTDDPTMGLLVPMSATLVGDVFVVSAEVNLHLLPGDYWMGITPNAPAGFFGPEPNWASATVFGDASASFDPYAFPGPAGWFNFQPDVDASFSVEGVVIPPCDCGDDEDEDGDDNDSGMMRPTPDVVGGNGGLKGISAGSGESPDTDNDRPRTDSIRSGMYDRSFR